MIHEWMGRSNNVVAYGVRSRILIITLHQGVIYVERFGR
jgi:hypothetical protein